MFPLAENLLGGVFDVLASPLALNRSLIADTLSLEFFVVGRITQSPYSLPGYFLSVVADFISESHEDLLQFESNKNTIHLRKESENFMSATGRVAQLPPRGVHGEPGGGRQRLTVIDSHTCPRLLHHGDDRVCRGGVEVVNFNFMAVEAVAVHTCVVNIPHPCTISSATAGPLKQHIPIGVAFIAPDPIGCVSLDSRQDVRVWFGWGLSEHHFSPFRNKVLRPEGNCVATILDKTEFFRPTSRCKSLVLHAKAYNPCTLQDFSLESLDALPIVQDRTSHECLPDCNDIHGPVTPAGLVLPEQALDPERWLSPPQQRWQQAPSEVG
ncbi:hypothetical protein SAMN04489740_1640 [Arthrobacter alpinus]|uniref:Uncharacterized protein n=1 Tax=Arthrobacter alpinus TaxID=656366 RepID=A0A1H5JJE9_9MICC|nr:hypothetical protein SAMN04489740_1640 [Arthrobacter alpinus]